MSRYQTVYQQHPEDYDALVQAEDHDGALRALLRETWGDLCGRDALELGVGTGRVTRWMLRDGARVRGIEQSPAMVALARARLASEGFAVDALTVGDAYVERFAPSWAQVAVAGWVFGHAVAWHPEDWSARVRRAIDAMRAAVVPGGRVVVVETLGTGYEAPVVAPALAPYFDLLASEGFTRAWARSDYVFASASEAERLTRFFFGDAKGDCVRDAGSPRVPECTGVWSCAV